MLTVQEKTYLRDEHPHASRLYMSVHKPESVYIGTIDGADYPAGDRNGFEEWGTWEFTLVDHSGDISNLEADMTVWIGTAPNTKDISVRRYRKRTGNTVTIDENSVRWHDYDTVYFTFMENWEWWPVFPYDECTPNADDTGCSEVTRYIDRDVAYTDQNENPPPVAIIKFDKRAVFLDGASTTITVDGSDSYVTTSGASISTYAWECSEATVAISDSSAAVATLTFTQAFPDGVWMKLTVTDSNGKSRVTRRQVFVHQRTGENAPFVDFQTESPIKGVWRAGGWDGQLQVFGDVSVSDFPEDAFVVLWQEQFFSGTEVYINGHSNVLFAGYVDRESVERDPSDGSVMFEMSTIHDKMQQSRNFTIFLEDWASVQDRDATDGNSSAFRWDQYHDLTARAAAHHVLQWYTTTLGICNVYGLEFVEAQARFRWIEDFEEGDVFGMIDRMVQNYGIYAHLCCNNENDLYFEQDLNSESVTDRGNKTELMTISKQDRRGPADIRYVRKDPPRAALVEVSGVSWDSVNGVFTPFIAQAPGDVMETFGIDIVRLERQALANQIDANSRAGQIYALLNNKIKDVYIPFAGNYSFMDVVPQEFYRITLDADETKRQEALDFRIIPRDVSINYNNGAITVDTMFDPEAEGKLGITIDIPNEPADPPDPPPATDPPDPDVTPGEGDGFGTCYVMTKGALGRTRDLSESSPSWTGIGPGTPTAFYHFILDPWAPTTTGYLATDDGVYKSTDLDTPSPSWTQVLSPAAVDTLTSDTWENLDYTRLTGNIRKEGWIAFAADTSTAGNWAIITTDGGDNWSAHQIDSRDGEYGVLAVAQGVSSGNVLYYARNSGISGDKGTRVYRSGDAGQTWTFKSLFGGGGGNDDPARELMIPYEDNADGSLVFAPGCDTGGEGIWKSTDSGDTFTISLLLQDQSSIGGGLFTAYHAYTQDTDIITIIELHALDAFPGEIWQSTDRGGSWSSLGELPDPDGMGRDVAIRAFGGFPYDPNQFYAVGESESDDTFAIYVTTDNAQSWTNKTGDWALDENFAANGGVIVPVWVPE